MCEVCGIKWKTSAQSAEVSFYQFGKMFMCSGCKYDMKMWDDTRADVQCFLCGATYQISWKTLKADPDPSHRKCYTCSVSGRTVSEDTKAKLSERNTGYKHNPESIEKIRARSRQPDIAEHLRHYGKMRSEGSMPGPTAGMKQSQEWIERRAESLRGQTRSEEFKERMREHRLAYIELCGGHVLPETRAKMSRIQIELRKNGFNPAKGHIQEIYEPKKSQPSFMKPRSTPYTLSSSWESFYVRWLDSNQDVVAWTYEAISIELENGKTYLTDFIYEDRDGTILIVEIKPRRKLERNVHGAQDKLDALIDYCALMTKETGRLWIGVLVDENSLEAIGFTL
jgi:hypothetical protein